MLLMERRGLRNMVFKWTVEVSWDKLYLGIHEDLGIYPFWMSRVYCFQWKFNNFDFSESILISILLTFIMDIGLFLHMPFFWFVMSESKNFSSTLLCLVHEILHIKWTRDRLAREKTYFYSHTCVASQKNVTKNGSYNLGLTYHDNRRRGGGRKALKGKQMTVRKDKRALRRRDGR